MHFLDASLIHTAPYPVSITKNVTLLPQSPLVQIDDKKMVIQEKQIHELSSKYGKCFYKIHHNLTKTRQCILPGNFTINIRDIIAKSTSNKTRMIFAVQIIGNISSQIYIEDNYLMKYSQDDCLSIQKEYTYLSRMYRKNQTKMNVPSLHPTLGYYWYKRTCFMFIKHINNTQSIRKLSAVQYQQQTLASFNEIDGGILKFILNCYDDIMTVINRLYTEHGWYHNDLHADNILVQLNDHKCFLIDFGRIYHLHSKSFHVERHFKCGYWHCSPMAFYHLYSLDDRMRLIDDLDHNQTAIRYAFHRIASFEMKYIIVTVLFHSFFDHIMSDISSFDEDSKESMHSLNRDIKMRITPESAWCKRSKLLNIFRGNEKSLNEIDADSFIQKRFWDLLDLFEYDEKAVNKLECNSTNN